MIEKLVQRLRQENHDPEMIQKIKDIYFKQFLIRQGISVKENSMEQMFLFLKNQPERFFGREFESFVKILSLDSQIDLLRATIAKGADAIGFIRFHYLDKLWQAPAETRLELVKSIASLGEDAALWVVRNLEHWHITSLPFQQRLEFAVHLAKQGGKVIEGLQYEHNFKYLQAPEPKEERIAFLKALVQKNYLEPKELSINLGQISASNARELAELGGFPAMLVAYHLDHISDLSIVEILVTKGRDVFQAVLDHLSDLNLKKYPAEKRLEILKLFFQQDSPLFYEEMALKILEESIAREDSVETLFAINQIVTESGWHCRQNCSGTIFKHLPPEGVSLAVIKQMLKHVELAPLVLEYFPILRCQASPEELS